MSVNENSLKSLWQKLPSERTVFTNAQMQARARKFQAKHKRRDVTEYAGYAALFVLVGYMLTVRAAWQDWVASGLVIVGSVIAMWNYNRIARAKPMPSGTAGDSLLGSMRRELTRQRDAASTAWRWYILPLTPCVIFIAGYRWVEEGATLTELTDMRIYILMMTAFCVTFFGACVLWQFLCAARYQRQLDDLARYSQ